MAVVPAAAQTPSPVVPRSQAGTPALAVPEPLKEVGFDQRLGEVIPLDAAFLDDHGQPVKLGDYLGTRPVVLVPVYYQCPMLCQLVLNGVASSLKAVTFDAGQEFSVVAVSIDPDETPEIAAAAKEKAVSRYGRPQTADGWHFLTGTPESIRRFTEAIGFRYTYDPKLDQFAHAAGIVIATPDGRAARYFYGVEYPARDLRLGLIEAADNKIGTVADQLLLFCFHYDPSVGKYSTAVVNLVRAGGVVTLLVLGLVIAAFLRREKNQRAIRTV